MSKRPGKNHDFFPPKQPRIEDRLSPASESDSEASFTRIEGDYLSQPEELE